MRTEAETMTAEAYIQYELKSERRHEYINGTLFEMPGEKRTNNKIAGALYILLTQLLEQQGYQIYSHDMKVAIPGDNKYYYPDVFVTNEPESEENLYIIYKPSLIVEVVSESSHKHDYVDKYIDYTQIPSLEYYIIAEPETVFITVHEREGDDWTTHQYTKQESIIELPKLNASLPVAEIYKNILPA